MVLNPRISAADAVLLKDIVSNAKWDVFTTPAQAALSGGRSVVEGRIFGEIRWQKTLGRPTTARLADGFLVELWTQPINFNVGADGSVTPAAGFSKQPPVATSDGPDHPDYHSVVYVSTAEAGQVNVVEVGFVANLAWSPLPPRGIYLEDPPGLQFTGLNDRPWVMPVVHVLTPPSQKKPHRP